MRHIAQPGPPPAERIQCVPSSGRVFSDTLPAGATLLEATRRSFAAAGFPGGVLALHGGALDPFGYVIPALSQTPDHAAFYSAPCHPAGPSRLLSGALTFGIRDGAPFFHCHALWIEAAGRRRCGHVLPEETTIAEPIHITAVGLDHAVFVADLDPETNFKLFGPVPAGTSPGRSRFHALRLRPNQDISTTLETFCRERGITRATLHGGVGSLIGATFADGRTVEPFATEMAITAGTIAPGDDGAPCADIDIIIVDDTGFVTDGKLRRGENPVFITLEIVLEASGEA